MNPIADHSVSSGSGPINQHPIHCDSRRHPYLGAWSNRARWASATEFDMGLMMRLIRLIGNDALPAARTGRSESKTIHSVQALILSSGQVPTWPGSAFQLPGAVNFSNSAVSEAPWDVEQL